MAGLLTKDLKLIFTRWQALIIFLVCAVAMGYTMDGTFVIGYLSMLGTVLMIGTASYDELDNGMAFLLTLPITKKTYVQEKFLFCIVGSIASWLFGLIAYIATGFLKSSTFVIVAEEILGAALFVPIIVLVLAVLIPIEILLGAQKSRTAMFVVAAVIFVGAFAIKNTISESAIDAAIAGLISQLAITPVPIIVGVGIVVLAVITAISYVITIKGLEKKEY